MSCDYDTVIKNGTIIDGLGLPRYVADIGIADGTIAEIGQISASRAHRTIDAEGLIVAPGAIDNHTHFDSQIHWDPYCTPNSWHGYTSVVATNCGFGFAPCRPDMRDRYMQMMEATEQVNFAAAKAALPWDWESFPEWMQHMERIPKGINIAHYLPLNPALCYVMGVDAAKSRAATAGEMGELKDILNRALDAGAIGFSLVHLLDTSSHTDHDGSPMPTDVHPPEDYYRLAEILRERGQGMMQALTDLPGVSTRYVAEGLAEASRRRVLHNTVGPYDNQPEFHRSVLAWLDECQAKGLDIYSFSPGRPNAAAEFTLAGNNLIEAVPYFRPFSRASKDEKISMASDPAWVAGARAAYDPVAFGSQGLIFNEMLLTDVASAASFGKYQGSKLGAVARAQGRDIVETLFALLAESGMDATFRTLFFGDLEEELNEVAHHPRVILGGTDGGAHLRLTTAGDSPSEIIAVMVRERGAMTLEQAHLKMSYLPSRVFGFRDRGAILPGYAADIMIYDYDRIGSLRRFEKVYDMPDGDYRMTVRGTGMRWVIVNGAPIFRNGECTGALPGRLVSNGDSPTTSGAMHMLPVAAE